MFAASVAAWTYTNPTEPTINYVTGYSQGNNNINATHASLDNGSYTNTLTFPASTLWGHVGGTSGLTEDKMAIRFYAQSNDSKPILEWRDMDNKKIAWITAHDKLNESGVWSTHRHISIETAKADMTNIVTRLGISYGKDITEVNISNAVLRLSAESETKANPSIGWQGYEGNGIYYNVSAIGDPIEFIKNGISMLSITGTAILFKDGSSSSPSISFENDTGAGIWYSTSDDQVKIANGGGSRATIGATYLQANTDFRLPLTAPASPAQGSIYFNTTLHTTVCYDTVWRYCGNGTAI